MTDPDTRLRRLFAEAADELPGGQFVAAVKQEVSARRRRRSRLMIAGWVAGVVLFSLLLAPLAPSPARVLSLGQSLTSMPEQLAGPLQGGASELRNLRLPGYAWWVLASCVPLAAVGWLLRAGRRLY